MIRAGPVPTDRCRRPDRDASRGGADDLRQLTRATVSCRARGGGRPRGPFASRRAMSPGLGPSKIAAARETAAAAASTASPVEFAAPVEGLEPPTP